MFYIDGEIQRTNLPENDLPVINFDNIENMNGQLAKRAIEQQIAMMLGVAKKFTTYIKYDLENSVNYKDYDAFVKALCRYYGSLIYDRFITDISLTNIVAMLEKAFRHQFDIVFKKVPYMIPSNEEGGDVISNVHQYWTEEDMEIIENNINDFRLGFRLFKIM